MVRRRRHGRSGSSSSSIPSTARCCPATSTCVNIQWQGRLTDQVFRDPPHRRQHRQLVLCRPGACGPPGPKSSVPLPADRDAVDGPSRTARAAARCRWTSRPRAATASRSRTPAPSPQHLARGREGRPLLLLPSKNGLKRLPFGSHQATDFVSSRRAAAMRRLPRRLARRQEGRRDVLRRRRHGRRGRRHERQEVPHQARAGGRQRGQALELRDLQPRRHLLLTNWAGVLTLRDGNTGAKKFDIPADMTGGQAVMPEWSPDGKSIVFVQVPPDGKLGKDCPERRAPARATGSSATRATSPSWVRRRRVPAGPVIVPA